VDAFVAPLLQYQADGSTLLVTAPAAPIAYQTISDVNANTTRTDAFDLGLEYRHDFGGVRWSSKAPCSHAHRSDLTIDGTTYVLAGTHEPFFYTGDTGNPKSRAQWTNTIGRDDWEVTGTLNHISAFSVTDPSSIAFVGAPQDTGLDALTTGAGAAGLYDAGVLAAGAVPNASMCTVPHFTTFDPYARVELGRHQRVHASAVKVFNARVALDGATYGGARGSVPCNPSLHTQGAVGAFFTLGATCTL
jgi:iron complex outermembrane receptor protein